jgi:hypothetical protein
MDTSLSRNEPAADRARPRRPLRNVGFVLGLVLLALALAALANELVQASAGSWRSIALGELWFRLAPGSLNLSQAIVQRYLLPSLWDPVLINVLLLPAWLVFGLPGLLLVWLGRPRR